MPRHRFQPRFEVLEDRVVPSAASQFTSVGAGGGGYYGAPSMSPSNPNDFYIATDMGAMYQTTDAGQHWTTLNPFQSQIGGTYYQPVQFTNDPNVLYANNNIPEKSTDGGVTWNPTADPAGTGGWISQLFADPNNAKNVVISANNAIYLSTDGGNSFNAVAGSSGSGAPILLTLPADNGQLYAAGLYSASGSDTLYVATNGGLLIGTPTGNSSNPYSWSLSSAGGLPAGTSIWSFTGATEGGTTRLYALLWSDASVNVQAHDFDGIQTYAGTYSLTVGQSSWTQLTNIPQLDAGQTDTPAYVAADPGNINVLYQGGTNSEWGAPLVWKSTDGGQTWAQTIQWANNGNIQTGIIGKSNDFPWYWGGSVSGISVCASNSNDVLITTNFAAFSTSDGGAHWTCVLVQNPQSDGSEAAGVPYVSSNNDTSNWFVNWASPSTMIAGYSDIGAEQSTNGGTSWAMAGISTPTNVMYGSVADSHNGTLYAAGGYYHDLFQQWNTGDVSGNDGGVYASTDQGKTWTLVKNFGSTATSVALDPSDPTHNTMYVTLVDTDSNLGGVWVTRDLQDGANAQWFQLNQPTVAWGPAAGQSADHHAYTVHVLNNGEVIATYSREDSEMYQAGVFVGRVSWSSGVPVANWTDVTPNDGSSTPDAARTWSMDLTIDPTDPTQQTWYLGTYILDHAEAASSRGLWRTTDGGQTWSLILGQTASDTYGPANPAKLGVFGGYVDPANGDLYVGTPGDGLWYSADSQAASPTFQQVTAFPFSTVTRVSFNPYNSSQVWVSTFGDGLWVGTTGNAAPPAPTGLQATAGDGQATLNWNPSSGASAYDIYRATSPGAEGGNPYLTGVTGTSFTDTGLSDGTTYYYEVSAVNSGGESGVSNEASATPEAVVTIPAAPTNLVANAGDGQVALSWSASSGATSYNVYRWNGSAWALIQSVGSTSATDTGLSDGSTYSYEVTAVNSAGESSASNQVAATPEAPVPVAPTGLAAVAGDSQVSLTWNASSGAASYNIYEGTSSGSVTLLASGVGGTSYTATGLTDGTTYDYEVTAVNSGGESGYSNQVGATPQQTIGNTLQNTGFESPNVGTGTYSAFQYNPSGASWNFSGDAGVAGNGSGFTSGNPNAPEGTQVGFLQYTGSFSQTVNLAAGTYLLSFYAAQRANYGGAQSFQVLVDGQVVGAFSGLATAYTSYATNTFTVTAGNHTITFQGLDPDGGDDTAFIDQVSLNAASTAPPAPTSLTSTAGNARVTLSWSASAGATSYDIYRSTTSGGETLLKAGVTASSFTNTGLINGKTYYYEVSAVNASGQSARSSEVSVSPNALPAVTKLSTAAGPLKGGTNVTISGTGFLGATAVYFGSVSATSFSVKSNGSISAVAPAQNAGTVNITVVTPLGTSATNAADLYAYEAPPTVSAVSPARGTTAGGTTVTISGTNLNEVTKVTFGGVAVAFVLNADGTITVTSPAHAAGSVAIQLTSPGGTSVKTKADLFTYF